MPLDEKTTTELEAAAFRRLLERFACSEQGGHIDAVVYLRGVRIARGHCLSLLCCGHVGELAGPAVGKAVSVRRATNWRAGRGFHVCGSETG